ncbi:Metal homeostasis factor ATX1 [Zancudomyces culisetae]|uniref:Metal homeostasis factor ATX1 n=1 Tax=Zancudomyces culisetae TaxID=1213189 RepID=A0A1R1PIW5_ZANCU|nr:Metal homeostasis factor ATX1 [Zancudomyces culisetae]|eukprot:OMH80924.1 Metal homeostasis factor ATX1 [Zancudomyces culisetae]
MENEYKYKVKMTCSGCSGAVNRVLSRLPQVHNIDIDMENQIVTVKTTLSKEEIFQVISKTGKETTQL